MSEQENGNGKTATVLQHEAAVSATIKMQTAAGAEFLFTVRSGATPSMVEQALDSFVYGVKYAKDKYHFEPLVEIYTPAPNGNGQAQSSPPEGEQPVCNLHNRAMKPSQYGGWYCTAKNEDGTYCKNKISAG